MRSILLLIVGLSLLSSAAAGDPGLPDFAEVCGDRPHAIALRITNINSAKGLITVDLYDDKPKHFLRGDFKVLRVRMPAQKGWLSLCLEAPRAGVYAIALYHDKNANTDFDRNFLGLPAEPYGLSNNPKTLIGPPDHDAAAFTVAPEGVALNIRLRD